MQTKSGGIGASVLPGLERRLRRELTGDVLFNRFDRGRYATDASFYQIVPLGVVVPRTVEEALAAIAIARDEGVTVLPRGTAWFDTGTFTGLMEASQYVHVVEARQGQKIGCVEEVAWRNGWLDDDGLRRHADEQAKSGYGLYLHSLLAEAREGI